MPFKAYYNLNSKHGIFFVYKPDNGVLFLKNKTQPVKWMARTNRQLKTNILSSLLSFYLQIRYCTLLKCQTNSKIFIRASCSKF